MKRFLWLLLVCNVVHAQTYNSIQFGGDLAGSTNTTQTVANGSITLAKQANLAASSIECNTSTSSATPAACNPLAVANLMQATIAVYAAVIANVSSLSGNVTVTTPTGNSTTNPGEALLLTAQTTASQNGIWIAQSGTWTRPANFPSGFVIAENCNLEVFEYRAGTRWTLTNVTGSAGTSVRIDTDSQTWNVTYAQATPSNAGEVKTTNNTQGQLVARVYGAPSTIGTCYASQDANGTLIGADQFTNLGVGGYCIMEEISTGHIMFDTSPSGSTSVNHGTLDTNASDNAGAITGLSAATSVTVTFGSAFTHVPYCTANDSASTAVGVTSIGTGNASVTFGMTALTGSLYYNCF